MVTESIRAFIAAELPENIISDLRLLAKDISDLGVKARWVRPENIHITLKFLGDIHPAVIENAESALRETVGEYSPIKLKAKGMGVFPGVKRPRVIWAGLSEQTGKLIAMQKTLEEKLELSGFSRDTRAFKAHLTIGRIKGGSDPNRIINAIKGSSSFVTVTFNIDRITLFKSELKPTGAVYTRIVSTAL